MTSMPIWLSPSGWLWIQFVLAAATAALTVVSVLAGTIAFAYSFVFAPRFLFALKPQSARYARQKLPPNLFKALVREIWTTMLVYGSFICWPVISGLNKTPGQGIPPVILVHGYLVSRSSWFWFMRMLARRGVRRPMYALAFNWMAPVEKSSHSLARLIDRALSEQGASQVDIIAHSWGGFLSRWYIEKLGQGARVRRLIMLGTPVQGTWTALLGFGAPRREMFVGCPIVISLTTTPPSPPYATLWSDCDELVTPPQLALLVDPDGNPCFSRKFTGIGHLTMQRDGEVADIVAALCENPAAWTTDETPRRGDVHP